MLRKKASKYITKKGALEYIRGIYSNISRLWCLEGTASSVPNCTELTEVLKNQEPR